MAWSAALLTQPPCIEVCYSGQVNAADLRATLQRIGQLGQELRTLRILADCTRIDEGISIADLISLANTLEEQGAAMSFMEAVLPPRGARLAADVAVWVATCRRHGMNVRLFADRGEALRWLGGGETGA